MQSGELAQLPHIIISGLMGMATFTQDEELVRSEFSSLRNLYRELIDRSLPPRGQFNTLSMGMSGDYEIAIEEGSNMVRVGSLIFGPRLIRKP